MRVGARQPDPQPYRSRRLRKRARRNRLILALVALTAFAVVLIVIVRHERAAPIAQSPTTQIQAPTRIAHADANAAVQRGAPWTDQGRRILRLAAIQTFSDPAFPPQTGVVIASARDGSVLYSHNAAMSLTPASVLKLVVVATALRDLGPTFRFTTRMVSDAATQADEVPGSVWLVGSGDPELTSHDLRVAVNSLHAAGIRRIAGDVVADGSLFGSDNVDPTWESDDLEYGYAAPTSAVTLDGGTAQFTITPDPNGGAADVQIDPPEIAGPIVGAVRTVASDGDNTLRIDPIPGGDGFQISGDIPYGAPQKYWRSLAHPEQSAANALRAMFQAAGIEVDGNARAGAAPPGAILLWSKQSRPLSRIIRRMTFDSDNHIAEQLARVVGARQAGVGTLASGIARERDLLAAIDAPRTGVTLDDASGLSAGDRITARVLAAVLHHLATQAGGPSIVDLLPRVGVEGTVRVRDLAPWAQGRVLGKDGYITGVSSLAGYVITRHHGVLLYAFVVNDWDGELDQIWTAEDDLLAKMSTY